MGAHPKDRILATCEENELTYVTDRTNFQPEITLRNALRAIISATDKGVSRSLCTTTTFTSSVAEPPFQESPPDPSTLPPQIQEHLGAINKTLGSFMNLSVDLTSPSERLRAAVKSIDVFAADIESQGTSPPLFPLMLN